MGARLRENAALYIERREKPAHHHIARGGGESAQPLAPVVIVRDSDDAIIEHWAGFQPDRLDRLAASALVAA